MMTSETTMEKSGSVGASWPPVFDAHNSRVKGFCNSLIRSSGDAGRMFSLVSQAERTSAMATRTTFRAFVRSGMVEDLRKCSPYGVEANFDVSNALTGYSLVYFSRNTQARLPAAESLSLELGSVRRILDVERIDFNDARERVIRRGYSLSRLNGDDLAEIPRLLELYQEAYKEYTFQLCPKTVSDMLNNGNVVIVARDSQSRIVSSLIAEHVELRLDHGRIVHLYELSDYATFREHRGNGLMTILQMDAIGTIRSLHHGQESIIYAEDRSALEAVNRSSQRAGMDYCGTLLQHCVLVSDRDFGEEGRYENLNVWAHLLSGRRVS